MKAAIGNKHQVVVKIIKQLDDKMIRDINEVRAPTSNSDDIF